MLDEKNTWLPFCTPIFWSTIGITMQIIREFHEDFAAIQSVNRTEPRPGRLKFMLAPIEKQLNVIGAQDGE